MATSIRQWVGDALTLFLLPAFVAMLPYGLGFRLLKMLARRARAFRAEAATACAAASEHVDVVDAPTWQFRFRLLLWVERADVFLVLMRSDRWWRRHVAVTGQWPDAAGGHIFLTYHWGAGFWIMRFLRRGGFRPWFLVRRHEARDFGQTRLARWIGGLRGWVLSRTGSRGLIYTGRSSERIRELLSTGGSVLGMLDLPARPKQRVQSVSLLDAYARLPDGLARLAVDSNSRVTLISCGLDFERGLRELRIEPLPRSSAVEILRNYARHLDSRLRTSPESWIMWREACAIFENSQPSE
ncbi:MAG TPA: hypothetical protein VGC30_03220 [Dokdonella sp.]